MRRLAFALVFLLCLSPGWSQDGSSGDALDLASLPPFDDSVTYELTGVVLNAWLRESQVQQAALAEALTKLDEAKASLTSAEALSNAALQAVNESLRSFEAYRRNTSIELWLTRAGVVLLVGYEMWRTVK